MQQSYQTKIRQQQQQQQTYSQDFQQNYDNKINKISTNNQTNYQPQLQQYNQNIKNQDNKVNKANIDKKQGKKMNEVVKRQDSGDNVQNLLQSQKQQEEINQFQVYEQQYNTNISLPQKPTAIQTNPHTSQNQDRQNIIKQTINKITQNIIFSKQEIVQNIQTINKYYHENQLQIKHKENNVKIQMLRATGKNRGSFVDNGYKYKQIYKEKSKQRQKQKPQSRVRNVRVEKYQEVTEERPSKIKQNYEMMKQVERQKKKQIYQQRKQRKKRQQMMERNKIEQRRAQIEKRIAYQQKFMSRRSISQQVPISSEQIKNFEQAFIKHIKQRLNIGKTKKQQNNKKSENILLKNQKKTHFQRKAEKVQKLKQKIILNLKQQIKQELDPTYSSMVFQPDEIENENNLQKSRGNKSAPQLRLPLIKSSRVLGKTHYLNDKGAYEGVSILKISNN